MADKDTLPDVYTNTEFEYYPGARDRSRPGEGPNETKYGQVVDGKGNLVSAKPANKGVLANQRRRLEHEAKVAASATKRASGSADDAARSRNSWTTLFVIALFLPLLSSFLTGTSYTFNLAPYVVPPFTKWWRLTPLNPFRLTLRTFTPEQLARYDGQQADKPLYIALAGEVYDVSSNRRIYGPGGSYSVMAGRDVSRAYITGCFATDLTHDLRGLSENDIQALENWRTFFAKHDKYRLVGHVLNPPIDPSSPIPVDCRVEDAASETKRPASGGNPVAAQNRAHAPFNKAHHRPAPVKATGS